ncbi:MAG TPA: cellulase family glycosylhydrolase [Abditibacteriaceae bacterium]|jgi:hypothetical protein
MQPAVTSLFDHSCTYSGKHSSRSIRSGGAYQVAAQRVFAARVFAALFSFFVALSTLSTSAHAARPHTATSYDSYAADNAASLQVSGNQILFRGTPVRLRGIAMGDVWDYQWSHQNLNAVYANVANNWKGNVVRLSVHPGAWRDRREQMLDTLRQHTTAALNAGLFVIITWHSIGYPDGYYQPVDPSWGYSPYNYDSDFELARDFWATVSSQFNDGRIVFELWNEPVLSAADDGVADDGTTQWADLKGYWQQLTDLIRGNGNSSLLLATGSQWAYNLKGIRDNPLPDANTAYSWHVYANSGHNDPAEWNVNLDGLDKVKPIIVTEWGFDPNTTNHYNGTAETFGNKFRDGFLEARGLHSTGWCMNPNYGPSLVKNDWTTPTIWGIFLAEYLRSSSAVTPSQPVVDPPPVNLLSDPGFELNNGSWYGNSCAITPMLKPVQAGRWSLRVQGRRASWAGPQQQVETKLINGSIYYAEAWVRTTSGSNNAKISLRLDADSTTYINLTAATPVNSKGWTKVSGLATVSWTGTLSSATWYVETARGTGSFLIDNCTLLRHG